MLPRSYKSIAKGQQIPPELAKSNPTNEYREIIVCSRIEKLRFKTEGTLFLSTFS